MTLLLLLSLFIATPSIAEPAYCADIHAILMEFAEQGLITYKEANEMYARCARAPDF